MPERSTNRAHWLASVTTGWDALLNERFEEAREIAERVRTVGVRSDQAELRAEATRLLAWHAHNFGLTGQALRWWNEALQDAHVAGAPDLITQLSIDTCSAFVGVHHVDVACRLCESLQAPAGEQQVWWELGIQSERAHSALRLGNLDYARNCLAIAQPLARPYEGDVAALYVGLAVAKLSRLEGEHQEHEILDRQIALSRALLMPEYEGQFVAEKAWRSLECEHDIDGAIHTFERAAAQLSTHTTFDAWVEVSQTLADLLKQKGQGKASRAVLREIVAALQAAHANDQNEIRALLDLSRRLDAESKRAAAESAQQLLLDQVAQQLAGVNEVLNGEMAQSLSEIREHLAVLELITDSLTSGVPTQMNHTAIAKAASEQIARIVSLLERGARRESRKLAFAEVVEDCLHLHRAAAEASHRDVVFTSTCRSLSPARVSVIRRVLQELLEHAVRSAPDCRTIAVSTSETEGTLRLEVRAENANPGVSGGAFLRGEPDSDGLSKALGLSIARKLLELSNGQLELDEATTHVASAIWSKA